MIKTTQPTSVAREGCDNFKPAEGWDDIRAEGYGLGSRAEGYGLGSREGDGIYITSVQCLSYDLGSREGDGIAVTSVQCLSCGGRFQRNPDGSIPCGH